MPRVAIDYSNTVFYKIYCKDERITDIYIGHTTNFIKRKNTHKSLIDNYDPNNDQPVYKKIRSCGGWNNWNMVEIEKCECVDRSHALKKELEYTLILKANLNSKPQINLKSKEFDCQKCNSKFINFLDYNNHLMDCQKKVIEDHKRVFSSNVRNSIEENVIKASPKFYCKHCNYGTECVKDYNKHMKTKKHEKNITNTTLTVDSTLNQKNIMSDHRNKNSSMVMTNKFINTSETTNINHASSEKNDNIITGELVKELIKENKELKEVLKEQSKELKDALIEMSTKVNTTLIQNNTTNNNNTTNHNHFNLNVFLNEQCKDAISITDFVDSLNLNVADLEATGKLGYVLGISRIFINKLKELDVYERPLHCTDYKRETVYIKNQDSWEKDNSEKSKLKNIVNRIARKNLQQLPAWQAENPDYVISDTPENNEYMKISLNSLGGYTAEEENKHLDKIMRNVLKEVIVDKNAITEI